MRLRYLGILLLASSCFAQDFDLLLRGGRIMDPRNNRDGIFDLAIHQGKVAAIETSIDPKRAKKSVEVKGLILTPGLIDIHAHVFYTAGNPGAWAGDLSVQPDAHSFRTGVTTMVDAGSAGWRNFELFRSTVIDRSKTRVLAMVNIAGFGMISDATEQGDFDPHAVARLALKHKDVIVGVKSAHYQKPDWDSVDDAVLAGTKAKIPVMVDFGYFLPERPYYELIGKHLRPGDISTHMFRAPIPFVDKEGKLYPYLVEARKRGIKFDVGHGGGSFVLRNASGSIKNGFYPDTISSDLHAGSMNGSFMDLPALMSKLMALGLPLKEAIRATTSTPAEIIQRPELGHLGIGAIADVALLRLMALANFGSEAGLSEQQVVDLMIHHRRIHSQRPRTRLDYFQRTIAKAFKRPESVGSIKSFETSPPDQWDSAGHADAAPQRAKPDSATARALLCDQISNVLGVRVLRILKITGKEPTYQVELEAAKIELPSVGKLVDQRSFRMAIASAADRLMPKIKPKLWEQVAQAMLDALTIEDGGEETKSGSFPWAGSTQHWRKSRRSDASSASSRSRPHAVRQRSEVLTHPRRLRAAANRLGRHGNHSRVARCAVGDEGPVCRVQELFGE